jgi:tRNA (adenine57-N1/adenine58-N1)-methyltransferase
VDRKERIYWSRLRRGGRTDIRGNQLLHDDIIGRPEGFEVRTNLGAVFQIFRPTIAENIVKMPRGATVMYPKDIGVVLMWADLFPGASVVEAGFGSGALAMVLLQVVGSEGRVVSYEMRDEFAFRAQENVITFLGPMPNHIVKSQDIYQGIDEQDVDRILLDLSEPWRVVEHAIQSLRPGGILMGYVPTTTQLKLLVDSLRQSKGFAHIESMEVLMRYWNVDGLSVRPEHQMVGHTGFLTFARRLIRSEPNSQQGGPR